MGKIDLFSCCQCRAGSDVIRAVLCLQRALSPLLSLARQGSG